jgi:recombination protein RecA
MKKQEDEVLQISKALINALNKDTDEKMAWSLASDEDNPTDVKDFVDTGSTLLNYIICNRRNGGVPVGKITEIMGEEATGKSLLVTHILANTQRKGGLAVYIDEENALNPEFAQRVGLDLSRLVYLQCGSVEAVGENIEKVINLARAKDVKRVITIVWDSIAATPPRAELEGDWDPNSRVGLQAKAIAKMMRKLTKTVGRERVTLVFTNQMKTKIGVRFGDPMGTPGGKAVPYHASVRVRLFRSTELKSVEAAIVDDDDDDSEDEKKGKKDKKEKKEKKRDVVVTGVHTRAKVVKGRLGPPLRACEFDILFSNGIDDANSIRDYLHHRGEIKKKTGWMHMYKVPMVKSTDEKGNQTIEVKDDLQFRAGKFSEFFTGDTAFYEHCMNLLDKHLIVKYDAKSIPDQEIDPESFTDAEAVAEMAESAVESEG